MESRRRGKTISGTILCSDSSSSVAACLLLLPHLTVLQHVKLPLK